MYAQIQTRFRTLVELADHANPTIDQTTIEEHALTHAQMILISTNMMVNARSAQFITELIRAKQTASEITASLQDNTLILVDSAYLAKLAQEPLLETSNAHQINAVIDKFLTLTVHAQHAKHTSDHQQ
tara:strand:- start:403 stop:786 length:384 start_codon:yes stop_codon:yes gene_type:complete